MAVVTLTPTNSQSVTITLASLAANAVATSSTIDNSTNDFVDATIYVRVTLGASGVSATGVVNVYLVRSVDGGTTWEDSTRNLLGSMAATVNGAAVAGTFSTEVVGGLNASHWRVAVENRSGAALNATAGNHSAVFAGIHYTVA